MKLWIKRNDNNEYNAKWPIISQALQNFAGTDEVIIFLNDTKQQMSLGNIINDDMAVPFLLKYFEQSNIARTNELTEVDLKDFLADYSVYVKNNPTLNNDADIQKLIEQGSVLMKNNETITKEAVNDALSGNTVGPFDTIEDFMNDLYEED